MNTNGRELVERLTREALERIGAALPVPPPERPARPDEGLPDVEPGSPIAAEWAIFRLDVEWLIGQGCKGRFALVNVGQPLTVWDTLRDADQAAQLLYGQQPCLIQEIQRYLPPLRLEGDRSCRD
jgi:hypothetical protein